MKNVNIEIKARCHDQNKVRDVLRSRSAVFIGKDHQLDTYFKAPHGRLKLREGNIENALIYYERKDDHGPKKSSVILYKDPGPALKDILTNAMGVLVVVDKQRDIYFIENVKFHLDIVEGLGAFVEIEAIDEDGRIGEAKLLEQCRFYLDLFQIEASDLIPSSYSDMLLNTSHR